MVIDNKRVEMVYSLCAEVTVFGKNVTGQIMQGAGKEKGKVRDANNEINEDQRFTRGESALE